MATWNVPDEEMGTTFHRWLGLRWRQDEDEPATLVIDMDIRPDLRGPAGSLEGGVIATLVDVAGATAVAFASGGQLVATEHINVSYLAPGRVGPVRATGNVLRLGRHDGVAEVRIVDSGLDNRLMAVGTVTVRLLTPRPVG
jgi:uncharacterized protein (TIGR00369 family)